MPGRVAMATYDSICVSSGASRRTPLTNPQTRMSSFLSFWIPSRTTESCWWVFVVFVMLYLTSNGLQTFGTDGIHLKAVSKGAFSIQHIGPRNLAVAEDCKFNGPCAISSTPICWDTTFGKSIFFGSQSTATTPSGKVALLFSFFMSTRTLYTKDNFDRLWSHREGSSFCAWKSSAASLASVFDETVKLQGVSALSPF